MVNVTRHLVPGGSEASVPIEGRKAWVIAEIVQMSSMEPIEPGGEFPNVADEILAGPYLVHAAPWLYTIDSENELAVAQALLRQIVSGLSPELWDGGG
jgi:hypothetical protein